ncbi:MAG: ABC transporter substrate-binding protein [Denitrovibrio sp.]|nr:MAG: ABC transporter substrate-binding protein [Denitrovibrio sp.]
MKKILVFFILMTFFTAFAEKGPIVVGSKIDTEGGLLGNMIVVVLENNDYKVINKVQLGVTSILRKAIASGQIDIYPEYTGNGGFFFPDIDKTLFKNHQKGYEAVKAADYKANKVVWLTPSPANNTWAIAVRKDLATSHNLKTLEDMAKYINKGGKIVLAASEEFANRPDTLKAFQSTYGFELQKDQMLLFSGGNTAQTEKAAATGTNGVNFAMAYGTDGALSALGLVVLDDTKGVQPVYAPAPVIRESVLKKYPEIKNLLKGVFTSLTRERLQKLNASIQVGGQDSYTAAKKYLEKNGFIK